MASITDIKDLDLNGTYTYADYLTWKFSEYVELIKGKILEMSPAPSRVHQLVLGNIYGNLYNFFIKSPCHLYIAPFDVRLSRKKKNKEITTVLQPDLCVVCDLEKLDDKGCLGAPDLVVEVLSPGNSKKEMRQKYQAYEEAGVKEYWIVHPIDQVVWVYSLGANGEYSSQRPLTEDDVLRSAQFPGLAIPLTDIFGGDVLVGKDAE